MTIQDQSSSMYNDQCRAASDNLIMLLSFLIGFQKVSFGPIKIFDLLVLIVFLWLLIKRRIEFCKGPYLFMAIILVIYLIQTYFSINILWSVYEDIRLIFCFISFSVFISLFRISGYESLRRILIGIFLYGILSLVLYYLQINKMIALRVTHGWSKRLEGLMLDPNYYSFIFILGLIILNTIQKEFQELHTFCPCAFLV